MPWYFGAACFFGGAFLANAIPHLTSGVSGRPMQSPFGSPPFKGMSSPVVNVAWGLFNLGVAYLLLRVGEFNIASWLHIALGFAGFAAMALQCARSFDRLSRA
jgi:hypothetical protein